MDLPKMRPYQPQVLPWFCSLSQPCNGLKYSMIAEPSICRVPVSS
jgi:hypothetical protein